MPVTGLPGADPNAWFNALMANYGAGQPYAPGAQPSGAGPQGLMPGGGAMGATATTPGQPSMGYPAMGQPQPSPAQPPAAAPAAQPGMSLTSNPITQAAHYLGAHMPSFASPAAAATAPPGAADPTGSSLTVNDSPFPVGNYAATVGNHGSWPTTARQGATGSYLDSSLGNVDARGAPYPAGQGAAANGLDRYLGNTDARGAPYPAGQGAPQGNPSATPRPASSATPNLGRYPKFSTFKYETPNSSASRAPIYTAWNALGRS